MKIRNKVKKVIAVLLSGVLVLGLDVGSFPGGITYVQAEGTTEPGAVSSATEEQSGENTVDVYAGGEGIAVQDASTGHDDSHSLCNDADCDDDSHKLPEGATWQPVGNLDNDMDAGYYYLTEDVTLTGDAWTPVDGMVLCLNGHSITQDEEDCSAICVDYVRTVTICNCQDTGIITHSKLDETTPKNGTGVYIKGGTFNMYGGIISGNYTELDGGGVNISDGTFNMYGGAISGNETYNNGGGVYLDKTSCTFNMYGGTISDNTGTDYGGGVYMNGGKFNIYDGAAISGNTAKNGGGVYMGSGIFNMNGGTIGGTEAGAANTASDKGGGVYLNTASCTFNMQGGTISGNTTTNNGGGVYVNYGTFNMYDGAIVSDNTAANGGGVYVAYSEAVFIMQGGEIKDNTATGKKNVFSTSTYNGGGGVYCSVGTFTMKGGEISGNKATCGGGVRGGFTMTGGKISGNEADDGGGVHIGGGRVLYMSDTAQISGNKAKRGAGVYVAGGNLKMSGGIIGGTEADDANIATESGGGVYMFSWQYLYAIEMTGGKISGNEAVNGGGVYIANKGETNTGESRGRMTGGEVSGNTATGNGGGAYVDTYGVLQIASDIQISGNRVDGKLNNVYLLQDKTIQITGHLTGNNSIGITLETMPADGSTVVIAEPETTSLTLSDTDAKAFFSDAGSEYYATLDSENNKILMAETPHEHYLCGGVDACNEVGGHKCDDKTTFNKWTSANDLPTNGVYYLTQDVTLDKVIELDGDLTLDLNGHIITSNYSESSISGVIRVDNSEYTLTLTDCNSSNATHTFQKNAGNGGRWEPDTDGNIKVTGGVITHSQAGKGSGIWVENGNLIMYSGTICGNETRGTGAGVHIGIGSFTMYGGAIRGNYESADIDSNGGGVAVGNSSIFTMYGGEISENTAKNGGGVSSYPGTFTMNGGKICNNTATENGGGLYSSCENAIINDGEISGNTAENGGGVYNAISNFTMNGGKISDNTATGAAVGNGGGVFVNSKAKFTMTAGTISGNAANGYGGGVFVYGSADDKKGTFEMTGGTIGGVEEDDANTTAGDGAGVAVNMYAEFTMSGGAIRGNGDNDNEIGGVYNDGTLTMSDDALISGNTGRIGGVYVGDDGKLIMRGGTITGNNSTDSAGGAGGVYVYAINDNSKMTVSGAAKIYDNWKKGIWQAGVYVQGESGTASNLYMPDGNRSNLITIDGAMAVGDNGAKIGVSKGGLPTKDIPIKVAAGDTYIITNNDTKAFFADAGSGYCIVLDAEGAGENALYLAHEHSWSYEAKDDTITATCGDSNCGKTCTLTIKAPAVSIGNELVYDGTEKAATLEYTDFFDLTGLTVPEIGYTMGTGPNNNLPGVPTDAGSYTATVSVKKADGNYATASVDFEIKKADPKPTDFTFTAPVGDDLYYSGTAKSATVTSNKTGVGNITVKYYNENGEEVTPIGAGTYFVKIDVTEGTNYTAFENMEAGEWTFTILRHTYLPIASDFIFKTPGNLPYDGSARTAEVTTPKLGMGTITVKYYKDGELVTEGNAPATSVTDAGTYTVKIDVTEGDAYIEYSNITGDSWTFTIAQKSVTVTGLKAEDKIYDGTTDATVTGTPVLEGLVSGDEGFVAFDSSNGKAEFEDKNAGTDKTVAFSGYGLSGDKADNYVLAQPESVTADITPREVTINDNSVVVIWRKTYDGKTSADVSNVTLGGCIANESLVLQRDYIATAVFDTAAVGTDKDITVTVELYDTAIAKNYTFAEGADKCVVTGGEIEKAAVTDPAAVELTVICGAAKSYKVTLPGLPALTAPAEYGKCSYTVDTVGLTNGYEGTAAISNDGRELTLDVTAAGSGLGDIGTITVQVTTDNYRDITLTVNVRATDKIIPQLDGEVTLSPAEITFGDALSEITITGKMTDGNNTTVPGRFEWQSPTDVLPVGTHNNVIWKFTSDDDQTYATATGGATVIVNKTAQSATVSMAGYTYNDTPATPELTDRTGDQDAEVTYYYSTDNTNSGGTEWKNIRPDTLNAGTYYMYAVIAETANYSEFTTPAVKFTVEKAAPDCTSPENRTAKYGQKLSDITLENPAANMSGTWSWAKPETVLDKTGTWKYYAEFTPDDSNYSKVVNVAVEVTVSPADGKNLATVELTQKYADSSDQTYAPDWTGLPAGQTWSYDNEYSVSSGSTAKLTGQNISAADGKLTYAVSGGKAGDVITVTLKALCDNYEPFTITLNITITKAVPAGEPKYTEITADGRTLADAGLTLIGSTITPADGMLEWVDDKGNVLPAATRVEANKTYKWRFTPADDNYTTLTGEVVLYQEAAPTPTPVVPTPVPEYRIIDGADSNWSEDTDGNLVIRGNGEYSKFQNVKVDGVVVDPKNYTVAEGSTIITLRAEYLETLSDGNHTFEIVWTDGSAATSFVVNLDDSEDDETPTPTPDSGKNTLGATVPPTGDSFNPALWITLLMAALAGLAVLLVKSRKNGNR